MERESDMRDRESDMRERWKRDGERAIYGRER
jgi:hypothetical protein